MLPPATGPARAPALPGRELLSQDEPGFHASLPFVSSVTLGEATPGLSEPQVPRLCDRGDELYLVEAWRGLNAGFVVITT